MRKALIMILAVGLVACASYGGDVDRQVLTLTYTDNVTAQLSTNVAIRGWIETIYVDVTASTGGSTGDVSIVYDPEFTGISEINLATNPATTADAIYRPRFDGTAVSGVALTDDPPNRFVAIGGTVKLTVTNAATGGVGTSSVWRAVIEYEKPDKR